MDMNTTIWQSKTPPSANPLNPLPTNRRPSLTFRQPSSVLKIQAKCDLNCQLVGRTDLSRHKNYHLDMACFYPKKNPYIDLLSLRPFSTISRFVANSLGQLWQQSYGKRRAMRSRTAALPKFRDAKPNQAPGSTSRKYSSEDTGIWEG